MKYFYKLGKQTETLCEETLFLQNKSIKVLKDGSDPLIIQFLSAFADDKNPSLSPPTYLQILLSNCCKQPLIQEFRAIEAEAAKKSTRRTIREPARYRLDRFERYIYGSESLERIILEWKNDPQAMLSCTREIESSIPALRGLDDSALRELIIISPFFKLAVALYIDANNTLDNPTEYFSYVRSIRTEPRKSPLQEESDRIRLLCQLARKYLVDPKTEIDKDIQQTLRLFVGDYFDIDINRMSVSKCEYDLSICMRSLLSTAPPYLYDDSYHPRQSERNAARAYHYYQNNELGSIGQLRLARYTYYAYMQDKDLLQLSDEQQLILQEMKTLLPYNDEIQPTPSGMLPLKMKHFFDKQCMLTQQDLFDEFEMRTEKKNAGCFFRDYFEACCISLISQCRPTHPIRRCSLCGRYHIATQNRMGDTIYCYRMSFQNPNKKCSEYNSHFVKKNTGSDRRKELNKKIENIRPYFSKITKVEDVLMFNDCVRYLRAWLVIAKAEAKRLDLCGQSIDHVEVVVNKIDQLRFQLSKNEVQERLIEIGKRIGYYPTIGELASALHQSQG